MNIDAERVLGLDLESSYKLLNIQILEWDTTEKKKVEVYDKARYGIKLKFDIYNLFTKNYSEKVKSHSVIVEGKTHKLQDFYTEIEKRETLIKKTILDTLEEPELASPR